MKQLKFRVRNNKTKKWIHGPNKEVNLFGEAILLGAFMHGVGLQELNDCVALQFTGLLDKNGKEIYEGDMIKGMFDFGPTGFQSHTASIEWDVKEGYQWGYWNLSTLEVIGNIFDAQTISATN